MLIFSNVIKSLGNTQKKISTKKFHKLSQFNYGVSIDLNLRHIKKYSDFFSWQTDQIHPIYPYSLLTSIHFQIVNNREFPFSPFGLIHKRENIICFKPLVFEKWDIHSSVTEFREIENGYEFDIQSDLKVRGELFWRSLSTIFKRTKKTVSKRNHEISPVKNSIKWLLPASHGLRYGLISMNLDPIHISQMTAKFMGYDKAIMHGMWGVARGVTEIWELPYPFELTTQFISPIYLPSIVLFEQSELSFSLRTEDGKKEHLVTHYTSKA